MSFTFNGICRIPSSIVSCVISIGNNCIISSNARVIRDRLRLLYLMIFLQAFFSGIIGHDSTLNQITSFQMLLVKTYLRKTFSHELWLFEKILKKRVFYFDIFVFIVYIICLFFWVISWPLSGQGISINSIHYYFET